MVSDKQIANAAGGKTARACDNCIRKRARWYCAADDAFLCQSCDASVHSANPLARRHERVGLKTSSTKHHEEKHTPRLQNSFPSWHHGFTKKARTPRHAKLSTLQKSNFVDKLMLKVDTTNPFQHLVPEMGSDQTSPEENEAQLLYSVPIFDPFLAKFHAPADSNEELNMKRKDVVDNTTNTTGREKEVILNGFNNHEMSSTMHGVLPTEMDLADFAADVESLLGKGLEQESFDMEGLGLLDCKGSNDSMENSLSGEKVKVENEQEPLVEVVAEIDMAREPNFELNFDYDSPLTCEDDDEKVRVGETIVKDDAESKVVDEKKKKILLKLNYEAVITAWKEQRSPWTTGERPELDPNDCWPDCMGSCGTFHHPYGDLAMMGGHPAVMDGRREARVSRYREKRRTRLFSKKIRYEVRKLNAEKRPRMKGRFVKRANFGGPAFPLLNK